MLIWEGTHEIEGKRVIAAAERNDLFGYTAAKEIVCNKAVKEMISERCD